MADFKSSAESLTNLIIALTFVFSSRSAELPHSSLSITLESSALWACFVLIAPLVLFICCAICFNAVFFPLSVNFKKQAALCLGCQAHAHASQLTGRPSSSRYLSFTLSFSLNHSIYFTISVLLDWLRLVSNKNRARLMFCIMQVWVQGWITLGLEEDWVQWVHTKRGEPCNCLSEWLREHSLGWR